MKKFISTKVVTFIVITLLCLTLSFGLIKIFGYKTNAEVISVVNEDDYEELRELWESEANYDFDWDSFYGDGSEHGRGRIADEYEDDRPSAAYSPMSASLLSAAMPPARDLSKDKYFPVIQNQGGLGACAVWSTTYYTYTYEVARLKNNDVKAGGIYSPYIYSPKWVYNFSNDGRDSGTTEKSNIEILQTAGCATWQEFPYEVSAIPETNYREWCPDPQIYKNALKTRVSSYTQFSVKEQNELPILIAQIKQWLNEGHPVVFASSFNWVTQNVPGYGVVAKYNRSYSGPGHSMTIVGYDDTLTVNPSEGGAALTGAFKIANSWGDLYGNSGYEWLMYDSLYRNSFNKNLNVADRRGALIENEVYIMYVQEYESNLTCEVTLNSASRRDIDLRLSKESDGWQRIDTFLSVKYWGAGGPWSFGGINWPDEYTFVFDFNATLEEIYSTNWRVSVASTNTTLVDEGDPGLVKSIKFYKGLTLLDEYTGLSEQITVATKHFYLYSSVNSPIVIYNFSENGGESLTGELYTTASFAQGAAISFPSAKKENWIHIGWNTNKSATTGLSSLNMGTANVTLYAIYRRTLTATFVDYSGSKRTRTESVTIYNKTTSGLVMLPAQGSFSGWSTTGWAVDTVPDAPVLTINACYIAEDTTFYGIYQRTLTLSYNANGGMGTPQHQTKPQYVNSNSIAVFSSPEFNLSAAINHSTMYFNKWALGSTGGAQYEAGEIVSINSNTTMYALWIAAATYTVTYNYSENYGIGAERLTAQYKEGEAVSLTPLAVKDNWTHVGWNTDKNATFGLSSLSMGTSEITLYAIYSKVLTGIFIDYNGASLRIRPVNVTIYNKTTSGSVQVPAQGNYISGWEKTCWVGYEAARMPEDYQKISEYAYVSLVASQPVRTYYGIYQRAITLSYYNNGGINTPSNQENWQCVNSYAINTISSPEFELSEGISHSSLYFYKWADGGIGGPQYDAGDLIYIKSHTIMYALFVDTNICTVTYNYFDNGGTRITGENLRTAEYLHGSKVSLPLDGKRADWEHIGWTTVRRGSKVLESLNMKTSDITLYAVYSRTLVATFIDYNGVNKRIRNIEKTIYNREMNGSISIPNQGKYINGWLAAGWTAGTSPNESSVTISMYALSVSNPYLTYYGIYKRTLTLSYDVNGGSSNPANQTRQQSVNSYDITNFSNSSSFVLAAAIEHPELPFIGWAVGSLNGTKYKEGDTIVIDANTTIYAVWKTEKGFWEQVGLYGGIAAGGAALVLGFALILRAKKKHKKIVKR